MELADSPSTKAGAGKVAPAVHLEEDGLLAELAILEYLLHQSVTLRLDNLFPLDSLCLPAARLDNLGRAHYYSQLVQSIAWRHYWCPRLTLTLRDARVTASHVCRGKPSL